MVKKIAFPCIFKLCQHNSHAPKHVVVGDGRDRRDLGRMPLCPDENNFRECWGIVKDWKPNVACLRLRVYLVFDSLRSLDYRGLCTCPTECSPRTALISYQEIIPDRCKAGSLEVG